MRYFRVCFLSLFLLAMSGVARAEYFFLVAGEISSDRCDKTFVEGIENLKAAMEQNPTVDCDLDQSNPGYAVISCTSRPPSKTYVADTEEACEALLAKVTGKDGG